MSLGFYAKYFYKNGKPLGVALLLYIFVSIIHLKIKERNKAHDQSKRLSEKNLRYEICDSLISCDKYERELRRGIPASNGQ